jgi:hypothetical protein
MPPLATLSGAATQIRLGVVGGDRDELDRTPTEILVFEDGDDLRTA